MIKHLTEKENLQDLVKEGIKIVDFYADWCGPCRMMSPILEELKDIDIIKIDIDKFQDLTVSNVVMSVPTLIFYKEGKELHREIGFKSREELESIINSKLQ